MFGMLIALIIALGELEFVPPLLAGIPSYESLDLERGALAQVGACAGFKSARGVPVWLDSESGRKKLWLPCTPEVLQLRNRVGSMIEVRSRVIHQIISEPLTDVWSVTSDGIDIFSYAAKVNQSKGAGRYLLAIAYPLLLASFYAWFAWLLVQPRRAARH